MNFFAYVSDDPVNKVDPTGRQEAESLVAQQCSYSPPQDDGGPCGDRNYNKGKCYCESSQCGKENRSVCKDAAQYSYEKCNNRDDGKVGLKCEFVRQKEFWDCLAVKCPAQCW